MWDLVGNPEDRFSHNEAQIVSVHSKGDDSTEADINDKLHKRASMNHHGKQIKSRLSIMMKHRRGLDRNNVLQHLEIPEATINTTEI